ncbi:MAG: CHRD domain-containing protein [Chloroflexota bacterium]|nr:CHRD domain-containing protein [Chloroflexota bacterium]
MQPRVLGTLLLGCSLLLGGVAHAQAAHPAFVTELSGAEEVPSRATLTRGVADVLVSQDGTSVYYTLTATDASTPIMAAHIHIAAKGENGPVVVTLCSAQTQPCATEGTVAQGTFTSADLAGPLQGGALSDLIDQMQSGNAYVNYHTAKFPDGEGRGQLVDLASMASGQPGAAAALAD